MPNIKTVINSHNHKITNPKIITKEGSCNCVYKAKCLLSQNFLISKIIFLTAIWLPHGQHWAILKGTASITRC